MRTTKHYAESKLGRTIEVSGVLFSWLIPFVTDVANKFKIGADGRTPYERITGHKCKHIAIGFAENVDFMLEHNKGNQHKADSKLMTGIFLGYIWKTTEYIVGTADGIYKCRTIRRKNIENLYNPRVHGFPQDVIRPLRDERCEVNGSCREVLRSRRSTRSFPT